MIFNNSNDDKDDNKNNDAIQNTCLDKQKEDAKKMRKRMDLATAIIIDILLGIITSFLFYYFADQYGKLIFFKKL